MPSLAEQLVAFEAAQDQPPEPPPGALLNPQRPVLVPENGAPDGDR